MVRFAVLRHRPLAGANLAIAANAGGFVGLTFMATLYMQQVLGLTPLEAGLGFLPLALSAGAGGLAAPRIIDGAGTRTTASLVATALAFAYLARARRGQLRGRPAAGGSCSRASPSRPRSCRSRRRE
jgi:hypothetical protein